MVFSTVYYTSKIRDKKNTQYAYHDKKFEAIVPSQKSIPKTNLHPLTNWVINVFSEPVTLFTFVIALSNFFLWRETRSIAEKQRQDFRIRERAYLSAVGGEYQLNNDRLLCRFTIKNHSSTPASNVRIHATRLVWEVNDHGGNEETEIVEILFDTDEDRIILNDRYISPGSEAEERYLWNHHNTEIYQISEMRNRGKRFRVYFTLIWTDEFGQESKPSYLVLLSDKFPDLRPGQNNNVISTTRCRDQVLPSS